MPFEMDLKGYRRDPLAIDPPHPRQCELPQARTWRTVIYALQHRGRMSLLSSWLKEEVPTMKPNTCDVRYWVISFFVFVCAACAPLPVGSPIDSTQSTTAPAIGVGETWTYRIHDGYTGLDRGTEQYRVE